MKTRPWVGASRWLAALGVLSACLVSGTAPALAAMLAKSDVFPEWTLTDHTGKPLSSRDLAGKRYLIWFYPRAMTPGCTAEGQGLRDRFSAFQAEGVDIVGVSFDTPAANAEFVQAEAFPFKLLSDGDRALAVKVGAADSATQPAARRISYLVGPDGKVLEVYASVDPKAHAQDVLGDLSPAK
jgi:peroxiredoxin Q/BCP